jgi:Icc-related predicted phosphoesterase
MRYSQGPHQYREEEMRRRCRRITSQVGRGKSVDVLVTHSPPLGIGDETDRAHTGFRAFHDLVRTLSPKVMLHGHIHLYGRARVDRSIDEVPVLNSVGYRVVEVEP